MVAQQCKQERKPKHNKEGRKERWLTIDPVCDEFVGQGHRSKFTDVTLGLFVVVCP